MKVFRGTWPACRVYGGEVVPTDGEPHPAGAVVAVLRGRAECGRSCPPDVRCGDCGAAINR